MNWLSALFRKKPDPLAVLRLEPSPELWAEERARLHEDNLLRALRMGRVGVNPWNSAAPGTPGAALMDGAQRGLFRVVEPSRYDYATGCHTNTVFEATDRGLAYLRRADRDNRITPPIDG